MTASGSARPFALVRTAETDRVMVWLGLLALAGVIGAVSPILGALVDAILIVTLCAVARSTSRLSDAATVLVLIPLLRILWVAIPLAGVPYLDAALLIATPFAVAANLVARSLDIAPRDVGMGRPREPLAQVVIVAAFVLAGIAIHLVAGDRVDWAASGVGSVWLRFVAYAIVIAYAEELAFRGIIPVVLERHAPGAGWILAAIAYVILALGAGDVWWVGITIGIAIGASLAVRQTGSLWGVIVGHAAFLILLAI